MISLLTMIINAVVGALLYALKAFFSLIVWFGKTFLKLLKLFFVVLPVTSIVFVVLMVINGIFALTDGPASGILQDIAPVLEGIIKNGNFVTVTIFNMLKDWYFSSLLVNENAGVILILIIVSVLMFIPVICVLLCITVFMSYGQVLFISVVADAAIYLLRAVFSQSFIAQAMGRYYRLFPAAGRRHEEREYDRHLKKRNQEFRREELENRRSKKASFYDDADYDDEDYEEDFEDEYEDEYDEPEDYYEDEYDRDEDYLEDNYEDEEYLEDHYEDDDYEDDYDDPRSKRDFRDDTPSSKNPASAFNFFAGCTSRESVDKKYKSLVKLYHPDNMDGDTAALQEINAQYAEAKKKFS